MPRLSLVLLLSCLLRLGMAQQLSVTNSGINSDPTYLLQNVLKGGSVDVSNVTLTGIQAQQIGYYSTGAGSVGSSSGMILSTGNVVSAAGTNDSTNTSGNLGNAGSTDPDLNAIALGQPIFDAIIYEFDVIPDGNQLSLDYIFASEEYNEYVCSNQADVFAILISGPGINGPFANNAQLISLVPSTSLPVGINTVNNGVPGIFGTPGGCLNTGASPLYLQNNGTLFEFDGYTQLLTATATVECGEQYHIRIILADLGNDGYDSGIFLAEGGVYSNGTGYYDGGSYLDSVIVEGCRPFYMVIYNATGFSQGETIQLTIGGTATNGVDYNAVPTTYVMSSSDSILTIPFTPIADGITEGMESVIVSYVLFSPCGDTIPVEYTFYIQDEQPLVVTGLPSNTTLCDGQTVNLNVNVAGGFPPYTIGWNGVVQNNVTVTPTQDITYIAEVSDQAGCYWSGSFQVDHNPRPIVNAGPDLTLCSGQPQQIGVQIDGGPGATYSWTPANQLNSGTVAYPTMTPSFTTLYTVSVLSSAGCTATDQIQITVLQSPTANAGPDQSIVYLQSTATLNGTGGGTPSWYPPEGLSCTNCFSTIASPQSTTVYEFSITGSNGCVTRDYVLVEVEIPKDVFVPSAFSPNGDGVNDVLFVRGYTIESMHFRLYDLWGQLIYENVHPDWGWDGTVHGTPVSIGMYVYTLEVVYIQGAGTGTFSGEINIVR